MKSFLFMIFIVFTSNKYETQGVIVNKTKNNLTITSNFINIPLNWMNQQKLLPRSWLTPAQPMISLERQPKN